MTKNNYDGQFGEIEKIIDEANLKQDLIDTLQLIATIANVGLEGDLHTDLKNRMKRISEHATAAVLKAQD